MRHTHSPASPDTGDAPASYRQAVITAYTQALNLSADGLSEVQVRQVHQALIAHAATDAEAAAQAGTTTDQLAHDRTTVDATDGLPLLVTGTAPQTSGFFYFARPTDGWPRPGHRAHHL